MGATVLVVEDNDFVRTQVAKFLRDAQYNVIEARDGDQAQTFFNQSIDIGIFDIRMRPVDGFDLVRMMNALEIRFPVIFVTGDQNSDMLHQAGLLGIRSVLMKPVEKERLLKMVDRLLIQVKRA
jgi:DNA-binding NtrC family response regulator